MPFKAPPFSCRQGWLIAILAVVVAFLAFCHRGPAEAAGEQRILSLAPAITEMVYALGLENRLVGVTSYCNYPPAAAKKPRVGAAVDLNEELVVALKPTLILAAEGDRARLDRLSRLTGAKVAVLPTRRLTDIWANMRAIGKLTGSAGRAEKEVTTRQARLKAVSAQAAKRSTHPTVFYMVWDQPLMTASADSFLSDLITLAGGSNVVGPAGSAYPHYSWESLLAKNPHVILGPQNMQSALQKLRPRYPHLQAVKANRLRTLPDDLISRPGPRVVEALEAVSAALR